MQIHYKSRQLERSLITVNVLAGMLVAGTFVALFGFYEPLLPKHLLYYFQASLLFIFVIEKIIRFFNVVSVKEFLRGFWFEIPLFAALAAVVFGADSWFGVANPATVRQMAIGVYLVVQVITKICRTVVNLAASGKNPTRVLIASFLVLIFAGAGLLMLPRASTRESLSLVDALFTSTSATCVTGLIVKDTGRDFTLMGQIVILSLIQLGGLGIVVFGAVFALLLGQAFSVRESVAMRDLLNAQTLSRIGNMIAFIFVGTVLVETVGAISVFGIWRDNPEWNGTVQQQWFYSIFHSISAFCNAGFSLFNSSFIRYSKSWGIYIVICPLIILGGLGFGVLYDLLNVAVSSIRRFFRRLFDRNTLFSTEAPRRMQLQSKIVLSMSFLLIVFGMLGILVFENFAGIEGSLNNIGVLDALFQSVTARTAGFNTIDIGAMSTSGKFILMVLMFVGGSPGSTAGGIKTVTLAVVVLTAIAALRRRMEVEVFGRSINIGVVGRAVTVTLLFIVIFFTATLALSITEGSKGFAMLDIMFESSSALGTVGLSTGITASLTTAGKFIIILEMLIGRLGPLTLLAALTFNLKLGRYNYPQEAVIVG